MILSPILNEDIWRCLQTLLDELVLPSKEVKDYLTNITGVSAKDLEGVTVTQADAQVTTPSCLQMFVRPFKDELQLHALCSK